MCQKVSNIYLMDIATGGQTKLQIEWKGSNLIAYKIQKFNFGRDYILAKL